MTEKRNCNHENMSSEKGIWTCDECGHDTTDEQYVLGLDRLRDGVRDLDSMVEGSPEQAAAFRDLIQTLNLFDLWTARAVARRGEEAPWPV